MGEETQTLTPMRTYTFLRVHDDRLDGEKPEKTQYVRIFEFYGTVEEATEIGVRVRLDSWILDQKLDWLKKDRVYWKEIYRRAKAETFVPGYRIMQASWSTKPSYRDGVAHYWFALCRRLPVGDMPRSAKHMNDLPEGHQMEYDGPRDPVQWLRALRQGIRQEAGLVAAGVRRCIDDYPPKVAERLHSRVQTFYQQLDCVDNIRVAQVGKAGERKRYFEQRAQGCCGFKDTTMLIFGVRYRIGCNYGH